MMMALGAMNRPTGDGVRAGGCRIEALVGSILLVGVLSSVGLVSAGWAWHWAQTRQIDVGYSTAGLTLWEYALTSLTALAGGSLEPMTLINMGIATLMLTPYVRVLISLLYFGLVDRNRKYTAFTGFVLAVLTYSLFLR
jgi:uncharacterized membrane protein